ncbi:MAG: DUF362 domain-containing protein [Desulfobacterales bacterium]|nr:DUF362 domain-containing protein [Desulfobacterales bacterium]
MGKVSLVKTAEGIKEGLCKAIDLIGGLGLFVQKSDQVMLKPNLNGLEGYTNKELVEALIQLLIDFSVKKIFMAEATFGDAQMTNMFFEKTGFADLARNYNIELINLNKSQPIEVKVKNPLVMETLRIAREIFEADKIINLPNMKVHYATGITLALKNLKGILVGDEKKRFHEMGLEKAIVDLNNTITPHLNVVDCISCMERMGPRGGDIVELNLIMAGASSVEVDYIGSRIMCYEVSEVKHLDYSIGCKDVDVKTIKVVGERIEDVSYPFKKVSLERLIPAEFNIHNSNACSSCMNAFLLSCQLLEEHRQENINVYMGELVELGVSSNGLKIAFGNCCPKDIEFDKRIKGCPPYPFALRDCLK